MTAEEYLRIERQAQYKHEFFHGMMFDSHGGTFNHASIIGNLLYSLSCRLKGTPCQVFHSDLRLCVDVDQHYAYPDLSLICGPARLLDDQKDAILNPAALFEVLSPSTAAHDRGPKFRSYQKLTSLREYFLVSQEEARVERFERQPDGKWLLSNHEGPDATLPVSSAPCELALREIYEGVTFE